LARSFIATLTHQPRALLEAKANGVRVYATATCGLDPADYLPLAEFPAQSAGRSHSARQLVSTCAAG